MVLTLTDYIVYIMQSADITSPLMTATIQYVINVVFTLPAILFLDKWGRRPSLVIGAFLMMTWLFIIGLSWTYRLATQSANLSHRGIAT